MKQMPRLSYFLQSNPPTVIFALHSSWCPLTPLNTSPRVMMSRLNPRSDSSNSTIIFCSSPLLGLLSLMPLAVRRNLLLLIHNVSIPYPITIPFRPSF
ncbi:hypothetical protein N657DRAFT_649608 [Parathielavia appendiculata]|uniref:Uncharacterized protein n=1 Tax=Parathielavia appendiculata TaxID=2587402 RepID=A0AAN6YZJ6_9PEZI|nr:hypothetical protein N657DRAFT_649608 [Parathielavia appendiculata]